MAAALRVLHGVGKGRKATADGNGMHRHVAEADQGEGVLEEAWGAEPERDRGR